MKFKTWHALAMMFAAVWLVYHPSISAPYNPIDDPRMVDYLLNRDTFGWQDFLIPPSSTFYRPLFWSSFVVDRLLWDLGPSFMHLENLFLHWVNATLVYLLARAVAKRQKNESPFLPCLAALLFALHPINSEAVIWLSARAELMATSFILLSLYCSLRYYETQSKTWLFGLILAFSLGCLSKETALFVWPGFLLIGWVLARQQRIGRETSIIRAFTPAIICIPVIGVYFFLRGYVLHGRDLGLSHLGRILNEGSVAVPTASDEIVKSGDLSGVLQTSLTTAGFYFKKLLLPLPLNFGIIHIPDGYFWVGCLLVVFAIFLLWRMNWPKAMLLTAMSLASVALLVAVGGISWTPVAERYMYAPVALMSVGFASGGTLLLRNVKRRQGTLISVIIVTLLLCAAVSTYQRTLVWSDNLLLFRDTVNKSPEFGLAQNTLAMILLERGEKAKAIETLRNTEVTDVQAASLNKILVFIEDGNLKEAKEFLLERLADPVSERYRKDVLKGLLAVNGLMLKQCPDLDCKTFYQKERLDLLDKLLVQTGNPFYHYLIGRFSLSIGERNLAQENFQAAYEKLPESSLYKEPAGRLANSLGK